MPFAAEPSRDVASRAVAWIGGAAAWLFFVAIAISVYEVAMRYVFNAPSNWAHVTTTALCAIGFSLGGAWCMVRREHIRITLVPDRCGPAARRAIEIFSLVVGMFYLVGLAYGIYLDAAGSIWRFDFRGNWTPELTPGPPNWPLPSLIKAGLLFGTLLFLAIAAVHLVRAVRKRRLGG